MANVVRSPRSDTDRSYSSSEDEVLLTPAMELALQIEDSSSLFPQALAPHLLRSVKSIGAHASAVSEDVTPTPEEGGWSADARQREHARLLAEPATVVHGLVYIKMAASPPLAVLVAFSYATGFVCLGKGARRREDSDEQDKIALPGSATPYESLLTLLLQEGCLGRAHSSNTCEKLEYA